MMQSYILMSNVPIDFEFEFVYKKEAPEITVEPMKGVIQGLESAQINVSFSALKKVTSSA